MRLSNWIEVSAAFIDLSPEVVILRDTLSTMKHILLLVTALIVPFAGTSQDQNDEQFVKQAANSWFNSFNNHDYSDLSNYTTEDCYMINPYGLHGKRTAETVAMFNNGHKLFLKDLTITVDSITMRFLARDVAVATVFSTQLGVASIPPEWKVKVEFNHTNGGLITTMVVVKQNNKWLIAQYQ